MRRTALTLVGVLIASRCGAALGQSADSGIPWSEPACSQPPCSAPAGIAVELMGSPSEGATAVYDVIKRLNLPDGGAPKVVTGPLGLRELPDFALTSLSEPRSINSASSDQVDLSLEHESVPWNEQSRYVVFSQPASFASPQFNDFGEQSPRRAVIIYEGMAIRIRPDGHYTVRMVVETLPTNVDLRLQFQLLEPTVVGGEDAGERSTPVLQQRGTVTLPAIRFRPSLDQKKSSDRVVWQAEQEGYSPLLHSVAGRSEEESLRVVRSGVIQVGSVPETTGY